MVESVLFNYGGNLFFFHKIVKTNFCLISNDCGVFFFVQTKCKYAVVVFSNPRVFEQ